MCSAIHCLRRRSFTSRARRRRRCACPTGERVFAYSGDTEWTDALLPIAREADLFICECYAYAGKLTGHMSWEILKTKLPDTAAPSA